MAEGEDSMTSSSDPWRQRLSGFVKGDRFRQGVTALILINALVIALQTSASISARYGDLLHSIDQAILGLFVIELALRLFVDRRGCVRSAWFWFDAAIVVLALLPLPGNIAILRTLRALRVVRLLTVSPSSRRVVAGLLKSIPALASVMPVLGVIFFVFAVFATETFGRLGQSETAPLFATLGDSLFTLFQIMTLENWSGVARPLMAEFPFAWAFFVTFVVITAFAALNLVIGIMVDALQDDKDAEMKAARREQDAMSRAQFDQLMAEIKTLRAEVAELRRADKNPRDL